MAPRNREWQEKALEERKKNQLAVGIFSIILKYLWNSTSVSLGMAGAEHVSLSFLGCPSWAAGNSALEPSVSDPFPEPVSSRRSHLWTCSVLLFAAVAETPDPRSRWVRVRDGICALPSPGWGWGSHCRALVSEHRSEAKGWVKGVGSKAEREHSIQRLGTHRQEQGIWHRNLMGQFWSFFCSLNIPCDFSM